MCIKRRKRIAEWRQKIHPRRCQQEKHPEHWQRFFFLLFPSRYEAVPTAVKD